MYSSDPIGNAHTAYLYLFTKVINYYHENGYEMGGGYLIIKITKNEMKKKNERGFYTLEDIEQICFNAQ